jgi:hypothetical protein
LGRRSGHRPVAAVYSDGGGAGQASDARKCDARGPDRDAKHFLLGVRALNGFFEAGALFDAFLVGSTTAHPIDWGHASIGHDAVFGFPGDRNTGAGPDAVPG